MKKLVAIVIAALFTFSALQAQESEFNLGDKVISLGIGIGNTLYSGTYYSSGVPPVSFSYEQAIRDEILEKGVIGIVGSIGYNSYKYRYTYSTYNYGWNYSNIVIAAGGTFHYPLLDKLDTYAALLLGYNIATVQEYGTIPGDDFSSSSGGFLFGAYVGGRYYFNEKFAAFAQVGYGIAYLTIGVSIRL
ncbi:MAG: hypothetical protein ABFS28_06720 [Bacteroidota bacterium]